MEGLSAWLGGTALHEAALNQSGWLVPGTQSVHILAIAILFGASLVIALRLAGVAGTDWTPAHWGRRLAPWIAGALCVLLLTGAVLILIEPTRALPNATFQVKMVLVLIAALVSWYLARRMVQLEQRPVLVLDRFLAFMLLALWLAIIAAGRWIGYS